MRRGTGSTTSGNSEPLATHCLLLLRSSHSASQSMSMVSETAPVVLENQAEFCDIELGLKTGAVI